MENGQRRWTNRDQLMERMVDSLTDAELDSMRTAVEAEVEKRLAREGKHAILRRSVPPPPSAPLTPEDIQAIAHEVLALTQRTRSGTMAKTGTK